MVSELQERGLVEDLYRRQRLVQGVADDGPAFRFRFIYLEKGVGMWKHIGILSLIARDYPVSSGTKEDR